MSQLIASAIKVSVILLLHGDPQKIKETIYSILSQTYDKNLIRILCLDDGSSPEAIKYLKSFGVEVLVYDLPSGSSISNAKNFGLRVTEDPFTFFLDDHIILDPDSVRQGVDLILRYPDIAGVCGYYQSKSYSDWNILRDIKRQSIYRKNVKELFISLKNFTTFSTGIAIVNTGIFRSIGFPEDDFPVDFGGEDVPAELMALNRGYKLIYSPNINGIHEHGLSLKELIQKMEVEVRGRYSLFYWASNHRDIEVPYLHGFLNFPFFFLLSVILSAFLFAFVHGIIIIPLVCLAYEFLLSLKCLTTPIKHPWYYKLAASLYVFLSDLFSIFIGMQYLFSQYKRPYKVLGFQRFLYIIKMFLNWELDKYSLWKHFC